MKPSRDLPLHKVRGYFTKRLVRGKHQIFFVPGHWRGGKLSEAQRGGK